MADQTLSLKLNADGSGLTATLQSASGEVQKFSTGAQQAGQRFDALGASAQRAMANARAATNDQTDAVAKLVAQIDPLAGKFANLDEQLSALKKFKASGAISGEDFVAYAAKIEATRATLGVASEATHEFTLATSQARLELGRIFKDLATGQYDRLAQSTTTLASQTGLLGSAFTAMASTTGIVIAAIGAIVAAIGYFAVGVYQGNENIAKFNEALASTNNQAGATGRQLNDLARQISGGKIAYQDAADAVLSLAQNGQLAGETLQIAARGAADFAAITGKNIKDTAKEFEDLAKDPTQGLLKLNDATHLVDASTIALVATAQDSGNAFAASTLAVQAFAQATADAKSKQDELKQQIDAQYAAVPRVMGAMNADFQAINGTLGQEAIAADVAADAIRRAAAAHQAFALVGNTVDAVVAHIAVSMESETAALQKTAGTYGKGQVGLAEYTIAQQEASVKTTALVAAQTAFFTALKNGDGVITALRDSQQAYSAALDSGLAKLKPFEDELRAAAKAADAAIASHKNLKDSAREAAEGMQQLDAEVNKLTGSVGGASAQAWSDYVATINRLDLAYAKAIAGGRNLTQAQALLASGIAAAKTQLDRQNASLAKQGDILGNFTAKSKNDAALAALPAREQAIAKAVADVTAEYHKQEAEGKPMADSLQFVQAGAEAVTAAEYDARDASKELQQALADFGDRKSPFEKLIDDAHSFELALKKALAAGDGPEAKKFQDLLDRAHLAMGAEMAGAASAALHGMQAMTKEGSKAYAELEIAADSLAVAQAILAVLSQGTGDPYTAFFRIAAMVATVAPLLAQIGKSISVVGGGSGPSADSAAVRQQTQGTGTVLGDAKAQSDSIAKAMDITAKATTALVGINRGMLNALQSLQAALGSAGTQLAQGAGNATFPGLTSGNAFNNLISNLDPLGGDPITKAIGNFLFGGSKKVIDQGIVIAGGTLQDMLNKIVVGAYQTVHTSGGLFSSGSTKDNTASVSDDFTKQFQLVIQSISDAVKQGATALGILPADIQAAMDQFKIAETHISLQGLSAEDQQKALEAVFSQIFDGLAKSVVPFIGQFQKVGEGLGETLVRVATEVQVTQEAIKQLGFAVNTTDPEKFAQIADGLATAAGGIDNFISGMQSFTDKFASDGDKFKYEQDSLNSAFDQLGLKLPTTRDGMMALMQSLDASTASGQKQIATLLQLTDVADAYYTALENQQKAKLDYSQEMQGINADLGKVSPLTIQLGQIRQWSIDESKKLNDLAKSAGLAGAAESDLARVQEDAAKKMAEAIAALKQSALDDAAKLGYVDTLDTLNAKIAALQTGASSAAASVSQAASSFDALSLEIGDNSPYSDSKKLALALQGLRAGTVTADQVLQIGRRLYASGDDYNKLFEQVLSIAGSAASAGAAPNAGSSGGTESGNLAALMAERDKLLAAQRKDEAQALAQKIADLAQGEHETVQQVAQELGINLADIGKDLGYSQDKIADYITSLEKEDLSGTFTNGAGDITDAVSSGADRVVNAIYDAAGKPVPAGATLPDVTRPAPGTSITPAPIAPSTRPPSAGGNGGGGRIPPGGGISSGDGQQHAQIMQFLSYLPAIADATGATADTTIKTHRALTDASRERAAQARRSLV